MPHENGHAVEAPPLHVSAPWSAVGHPELDFVETDAEAPATPESIVREAPVPGPVAQPEIVPSRRRLTSASIVATVILLVLVAWGVAVQTGKSHGPYQTVDGVVTALDGAGLNCEKLEVIPTSDPRVREQAACALDADTVRIYTFQSSTRRTEFTPALTDGYLVSGRMWLIVTGMPRTAFRVAQALGGVVLPRPGNS